MALAELLLVAAGLIEFVKLHGPANFAHPPIHQDIVSDRGSDVGGWGRRDINAAVVAFSVVVLPT